MQEVKFRAWDKWNKQYFENLNNIFITGNGEIGIVDKSGHNLIEEYQERFVSEFSTGLKDKNGVEIYENDIVRCSRGCPHKVFWEEEIGGMFGGGMPGWYLSGLNEGYAWTNSEEVIGNIHENTDLLEETT